jgi:hypothetical protein
MPATPDESNHLISLLDVQTDAPLSGEPRNHGDIDRVAFCDRGSGLTCSAALDRFSPLVRIPFQTEVVSSTR